jgi:hypothetical protein
MEPKTTYNIKYVIQKSNKINIFDQINGYESDWRTTETKGVQTKVVGGTNRNDTNHG